MRQPDRIIRLNTVLAPTGLSRIYRKIAFPAQIRIGVNSVRWRESHINRWVANPVAWWLRRSSTLMTSVRTEDNGVDSTPRSRCTKRPLTARDSSRNCWTIRGRFPAGRASMTCPHGPSPMTGSIPFRPRKPRSSVRAMVRRPVAQTPESFSIAK